MSESQVSKFEQLKERNVSLQVALTAITAALYIALGYLFQPISFPLLFCILSTLSS